LFADLPEDAPEAGSAGSGPASAGSTATGSARTGSASAGSAGGEPPRSSGRPRRRQHLLAIVLIVVIAIAAGHALAQVAPWLLIAALAFLWLRHGPLPHRRP
jgi:hypothetical protein